MISWGTTSTEISWGSLGGEDRRRETWELHWWRASELLLLLELLLRGLLLVLGWSAIDHETLLLPVELLLLLLLGLFATQAWEF